MINYSADPDGIATIEWDMPGVAQNLLSGASMKAFRIAAHRAMRGPSVRGILITSAKADFMAGVDLSMVLGQSGFEPLHGTMLAWHRLLREMETAGKPLAIALSGDAVGCGLALALACHYRVAADSRTTRLGFPEVRFGLPPDGSGSQRLLRMIGMQAAMALLTLGKRLTAKEALSLGLIDAIAPTGNERGVARSWLLDQGRRSVSQPWDQAGFQIPAGTGAEPARGRGDTPGSLPERIAACLEEGARISLEAALAMEARHFAEVAISSAARNKIRTLHFALNEANSLAARPQAIPTETYRRIGVLGAGMMGSAIAFVAARSGIEVVLLDVEQAAAERGKDYARRLLAKAVGEGGMNTSLMEAVLARITPSMDFDALKGCQLVVEAVFEDRSIKAEATRKAESVLAPDAVFASNTSTLPITGLAEASRRPSNFIGLHFFSPVERMPLVEVVRGEQTSDAALARALDFVRAVGKTPVVVHDGRGFYTSRALRAYIAEAASLIEEGVDPALIEQAAHDIGMPIGPLALVDDVSIELLAKFARQDKDDLGEAYSESAGDRLITLMAHEFGRPGRKAGKGFYDYPADGGKHIWPGLAEHFRPKAEQPAPAAVGERLLLIQSVETARCMEEGVVLRPEDADVAAVLGWGYPSEHGGPIGWIHTMGIAEFMATCDRLAAECGERFVPPQLLRRMVAERRTFYPD